MAIDGSRPMAWEVRMMRIPYLETNIANTNRAFRIAVGDLTGNIIPFRDGLLKEKKDVVIAGMDYVTPWTRDAAINTWNGAGLLFPEVTRNTLLSVLDEFDGEIRIAGEYWDAVIWAVGAWWQYLYTGDGDFLKTALSAVKNSLAFWEKTEFTQELNLFRGGACYGDGVSAYPDIYTRTEGNMAGIIFWPPVNQEKAVRPGKGLPMHVLSTNCLYYEAYEIMGRMAAELGLPAEQSWSIKAGNIKRTINKELWNEEAGRYDYFLDKFGGCNYQEGIGQSFSILFGIAGKDKSDRMFENVYVSPAGIPCVWPSFKRYETSDAMGYGRHSGTVWPHIQGFWAHAAAMCRKEEIFRHELDRLVENVSRDSHFAELYHPVTGEMYGGRQEAPEDGIIEWKCSVRQTWSATAFMRMIMMGLAGMNFGAEGIEFKPFMVEGYDRLELSGLHYRNMILNISIKGTGTRVNAFRVNGEVSGLCRISAQNRGNIEISIVMGK